MFLPPAVLGPFYGNTGASGIGTGVLPGAKPLKAPGKIEVPLLRITQGTITKFTCTKIFRYWNYLVNMFT